MAYTDTLKEVGLSLNEARIYEALLKLGESSITQIATHTSIHRRNVYDAVHRLTKKGIVIPIIGTEERRFEAVEPQKLLEIVEEKRAKLEAALPDLQKLFAETKSPETVLVYKGSQGLKNIMRDTLKVGEPIYTIGGKAGWLDSNPYSSLEVDRWIKETRKRNMILRSLLDVSAKQYLTQQARRVNSEYRFLPESTPAAIDVYGDRVVIYLGDLEVLGGEDFTAFVIISKKLAESYKQWFQFMWDHCEPPAKAKTKE